jgi:hypothetical protein
MSAKYWMSTLHSGSTSALVMQLPKYPMSNPIIVAVEYVERNCLTTQGPTYPIFPVTKILIILPPYLLWA